MRRYHAVACCCLLGGCAVDGSVTLRSPGHGHAHPHVRACNGPVYPAPPPPVIHSEPLGQLPPTGPGLEVIPADPIPADPIPDPPPAPTEARPTSAWRPARTR